MQSLWIVIGSFLALSAYADVPVISTCGNYKITYDGERSGWFAGVNVKQSQFSLFLPDGSRLSTRCELNSEGGRLFAESSTTSGKTSFVYEDMWDTSTLKIISPQGTVSLNCVRTTNP